MTLTFLNSSTGNTAPYNGFPFYDPTTLLSTIQTYLNNASWSSITYISGSYLFVQGNSIVGSYPCFIDFTVTNSGYNYILTLRAWLESGKINGSPTSTHYLTFYYNGTTNGNPNLLWLTANAEAGCICIYNCYTNINNLNNYAWISNINIYSQSVGVHFGFLDRVDTTDQWAWMIGYICCYVSGLSVYYAYVAKSKYNNTIWHQLSSYFNTSIGSSNCNYFLSQFDLLTRWLVFSNNGILETSNLNPNYLAIYGKTNYDGSCIIDSYFYQEGKGSTNNYSTSSNCILYYRGNVQFTYCGVASLKECTYVIDSNTSYGILSTGYLGWQGMRIF